MSFVCDLCGHISSREVRVLRFLPGGCPHVGQPLFLRSLASIHNQCALGRCWSKLGRSLIGHDAHEMHAPSPSSPEPDRRASCTAKVQRCILCPLRTRFSSSFGPEW